MSEGNYIAKICNSCNANCLFCADSREIRNKCGPSFSELLAELKGSRRKFDSIIITGGEPTIYPKLIEYLVEARSLGYKRTIIATNGFRLQYPHFVKKLKRLGVTGYQLSFQTTDAKLYYSATGIKNALPYIEQAIKNIIESGESLHTNTCIHKLNYKSLPDIARFLEPFAEHIQFSFINPVGSSIHNGKSSMAVSFTDAAIHIKQALATTGKASIENVPLCVLPEHRERISDFRKPEDNKGYYNKHKTKPKKCESCSNYQLCDGIWEAYLAQFGDRELKALETQC